MAKALWTPAAWVLISVALAGAYNRAMPAASRDTSTVRYQWPMDKYGNRWDTLEIPRAFVETDLMARSMNKAVNPPKAVEGPLITQILVKALWPDLAPDSDAIRQADKSNGRNLILALIESGATASFDGKKFNRLQIAYDVAINDSTNNICILPYEWSVQPHPTRAECLKRSGPDVKAPEFGLDRLGVDFAKFPNIPNATRKRLHEDDLYYSRGTHGHLQTFIQCTAVERAPDNRPDVEAAKYPCTHQFISPKLDAFVILTYPRAYLKDWQSIEKRWNDLIDTFVSRGSSGSGETDGADRHPES